MPARKTVGGTSVCPLPEAVSGRDPSERQGDARDVDTALALYAVSRETRARLETFVAELRRWQRIKNLVGPGTLDQIWVRHVADSLQLLDYAPGSARRWLDLGSGAGFPGLVIGIAAAGERRHLTVELVESNARKCAFLRHAIRTTGAHARVTEARIETLVAARAGSVDVVSARALASLASLVGLCRPLLINGAVALFPKGRGVERELTEAARCWTLDADVLPSRTDPEGRIVRVTALHERPQP